MYLCDSDWMIDFIEGRQPAIQLLGPLFRQGMGISLISVGEIFDGILYGRDPVAGEQDLDDALQLVSVLTLDLDIVRRFGDIRGRLRLTGKLIPDNDLLIAATALRYDLTLVTRNRRHFDRIPGLRLHEPDTAS